jgi:hypothetical protein
MALLAVFIPLLMLGVVLALGRYEELLLQTKKTDQSEDALADPVAATMPIRILPTPGPARTGASGTSPSRPSDP